MLTLEQKYRKDPSQLAFLKERLLIPEWAGQLDDMEAEYVSKELCKSGQLRRLWQVRKFSGRRKVITPPVAQAIALRQAGLFGTGQFESHNLHTKVLRKA